MMGYQLCLRMVTVDLFRQGLLAQMERAATFCLLGRRRGRHDHPLLVAAHRLAISNGKIYAGDRPFAPGHEWLILAFPQPLVRAP